MGMHIGFLMWNIEEVYLSVSIGIHSLKFWDTHAKNRGYLMTGQRQ